MRPCGVLVMCVLRKPSNFLNFICNDINDGPTPAGQMPISRIQTDYRDFFKIIREIGIEKESSWANCYISLSLVTVVFLSLALKVA
jgi:hypothetical protein